MEHTHYLSAKQSLIDVSKQIKSSTNDKPLIRQVINDTADSLIKDLPYSLSDATRELYSKKTYIRSSYCRESKKYELQNYEDISDFKYVRKGTMLQIGFTY